MFKVSIKKSKNENYFQTELFRDGAHAQSWANEESAKDGYIYDVEDVTESYQLEKAKKSPREYLNGTDWYAMRKADTGEEIPSDIASARQAARELL